MYTHPNEDIPDPSYLMYLDVNNPNGWATCQTLTVGKYEWLSEDKEDECDYNGSRVS